MITKKHFSTQLRKDIDNYKRYKEISKNIDEETKPIVEKLSKDVTKLQNKANDEINLIIDKYDILDEEIQSSVDAIEFLKAMKIDCEGANKGNIIFNSCILAIFALVIIFGFTGILFIRMLFLTGSLVLGSIVIGEEYNNYKLLKEIEEIEKELKVNLDEI